MQSTPSRIHRSSKTVSQKSDFLSNMKKEQKANRRHTLKLVDASTDAPGDDDEERDIACG